MTIENAKKVKGLIEKKTFIEARITDLEEDVCVMIGSTNRLDAFDLHEIASAALKSALTIELINVCKEIEQL